MAYIASAIEIILASPSDVEAEREIFREVIAEWNAINSRDKGIVLMPLSWESHSSPELGDRPQQFISDRVLAHADILVGILWTRVGTPTGKAISGTIEEIEEHLKLGKPVMLYFSNAPVEPGKLDHDQYQRLIAFKERAQQLGLIETFDSSATFRDKFRRQLPLTLRDNPYLRDSAFARGMVRGLAEPTSRNEALSDDAKNLLRAAVQSPDGQIYGSLGDNGAINAGTTRFGGDGSRRTAARWEGAIEELVRHGFAREIDEDSFELTDAAYKFADDGK